MESLVELNQFLLKQQAPRPGLIFDRTKHRWVRPPREKLTPSEAGRRGGQALVAKHGKEHMSEIGKRGFAVTVGKIYTMVADPDISDEKVEGYFRFLRNRLKLTSLSYRKRFRASFGHYVKEHPEISTGERMKMVNDFMFAPYHEEKVTNKAEDDEEYFDLLDDALSELEVLKKGDLVDPYSELIYDYIDGTLTKAGVTIEGQQSSAARYGKGIEGDVYNSLVRKVDKMLEDVPSDLPQHELVNKIHETVQEWQEDVGVKLADDVENLFLRGYATGVISSGVKETMGLEDKMALELLQSNPDRLGARIVTFSDDLIDKFRTIIANSYTADGIPFDVDVLVAEMRKEVPAERWKLERIVRTEVAGTSNLGRLVGYNKDPDKYYYDYKWRNPQDLRSKMISKLRVAGNPYSFSEICFLWERQEQKMPNGEWMNDAFNQRCSISRSPRDDEFISNRFEMDVINFNITSPLGFSYT